MKLRNTANLLPLRPSGYLLALSFRAHEHAVTIEAMMNTMKTTEAMNSAIPSAEEFFLDGLM